MRSEFLILVQGL
jgi:Ca2+-binding EF-hand superfamily protein